MSEPKKSRRSNIKATTPTLRRKPFSEPEEDIPREVKLPNTTREMFVLKHPDKYAEENSLKVRDAVPPPPGFCYTLDGRIRPLLECKLSIEDPSAQAIFAEVLEVTGSFRAACDCLGIVNVQKVYRYMETDIEFADMVEAAADRHRHHLYAVAMQRATIGYQVPIIGGKDKDQIVAYETRMSDSLLAMLLKRHFPEFRETRNVAVNVDNRQVNVQMPDMTTLSREQREAMRKLLSPAPDSVDLDGVIDVDPNSFTEEDN